MNFTYNVKITLMMRAEILKAPFNAFQVGREFVGDKSQEMHVVPTVPERFNGMKAAIITNNSSLSSLGSRLGLNVLHWNKLNLSLLATELLKLLGFQEGKTLETNQFDLIFVHVGADEKINDLKDIEFITHLVGELMHMAQPESDIGSRLHMSIIMSYGATLDDDNSIFVVSDAKLKINNELSLLFPRQSYTMKGGKPNKNIRHYSPMLVGQWQNAVTRKDMVEEFSFRDFIEHGGNLVIPADRFLHEVAFKLWKAPKYGA
ncbi:Hypothetical predicted protein [Olea europaea subsp. europaea]|uniref:Uncharacterized protein n=1 Tax=Olea europaea subsp. europaea TaxID=158383 RepID=A0A8S0UHK0_OLEEU|nr:Hypothetical predicted protein [Olea europaea subsp. europaea]